MTVVHDMPFIYAHSVTSRFGQNTLFLSIDIDEFLLLNSIDGQRDVRFSLEACLFSAEARLAGIDPRRDMLKQLQFRRYDVLCDACQNATDLRQAVRGAVRPGKAASGPAAQSGRTDAEAWEQAGLGEMDHPLSPTKPLLSMYTSMAKKGSLERLGKALVHAVSGGVETCGECDCWSRG